MPCCLIRMTAASPVPEDAPRSERESCPRQGINVAADGPRAKPLDMYQAESLTMQLPEKQSGSSKEICGSYFCQFGAVCLLAQVWQVITGTERREFYQLNKQLHPELGREWRKKHSAGAQ